MKRISLLVIGLTLSACSAAPMEGDQQQSSSAASTLSSIAISSVSDLPPAPVATGYKKLRYFNAEVPATWSISYGGDAGYAPGTDGYFPIEHIMFSVGQHDIAYGDMNWSQVDVAIYEMANGKRALDLSRAESEQWGTWSVETVDGKHADVFTSDLDNGQVTKGGSGGKDYFIALPNQQLMVRIWKQALGDDAFEAGFRHFLQSLDFEA